jgi:hypothetical protein
MDTSESRVVPGQEGLDHPSDPGAGEQQTGSWRPSPGKMATIDQSGLNTPNLSPTESAVGIKSNQQSMTKQNGAKN